MDKDLILGHWGRNAFVKGGERINEVFASQDYMRWLVAKSEKCPYTKADGSNYDIFKRSYLPIIYFTDQPYRPDKESPVIPSGFCCIDIDNTNTRFIITHPSVFAVNYTSNGTHIIAHSFDGWGSTNRAWQQTYDRMAFIIQQGLENEYGIVKFDGKCSVYYQGCYVWKTDWWFNDNFDPYYRLPDTYPTQAQIEGLYTKTRIPVQDTTIKTAKGVVTVKTKSDEIKSLADHLRISDGVQSDFLSLNYSDFLKKYADTYEPFTDEEPVFTEYTDYDGNVYSMCKTNGTLVKFWLPFMKKGARGTDCRIKKGHRRNSIFTRALSVSQHSGGGLDPDRILFDAVWWYETWCDHSEGQLDKREFLLTVSNAIAKREHYECRAMVDRRSFISGNCMIDADTGEVIPMDKGRKIAANAKCRRTDRIVSVVREWNPNMSVEENIEEVRAWCDGMEKTSERTIVGYIRAAQKMPRLVEDHPWLATISFNGRGRSSKPVKVRDIESGEVHTFESVKACMEGLGIKTRRTFTLFVEGKTKLNRRFEVI